MITREQASEIRARSTALNAWVDSIRDKRSGWASWKPEDKPASVPDVTNEERSALEVYDFCTTPPDRYFLYVNREKRTATTWTGDTIGTVDFGAAYQCPAFGGSPSTRVPVTIHGINGKTYHGTWYKSTGDFARVKLAKHQRA